MKTRKKIEQLLHRLLQAFQLKGSWLFFLVVVSAFLLSTVFIYEMEDAPHAYVAYMLSAYTFTALIIYLISAAKQIKQFAYKNQHISRYITNLPYRIEVSLTISLVINLIYAIFKLIAGISYSSYWFGAIAVYYILLGIIRYVLLAYLKTEPNHLMGEYRQYRTCGYLLFFLNIALSFVFYEMIYGGKSYQYPGSIIYAAALYTFYALINATVSIIKFRKLNRPALSATKAVNLTVALVSVFSLQTSMFATFGGDRNFEWRMNVMTGSTVSLLIFLIAGAMIKNAGNKIRDLESDFYE